ncbi:potassium channel family protein [Parasphingorhabdus sp.]|uniref:potassium channel family protein n=1 Tax=Parasphingorhabdus sp. TaxID=2709688 RepID=UPI003D2A20F6
MFGITGFVHFQVIHRTHSWLKLKRFNKTQKLMVGLYAAAMAHIFEAGLYAIAFLVGSGSGLGGFKPSDNSLMETFYFSLVNYTSLGLGDIYPTGHLRFLAGIESLNGFLLISCSASLIFILMTETDESREQSKPKSQNA